MYKTTKCRRADSLTNKIKSTVMLLMLFVSFGSYAQYCDVTSTSTTYGVGSFITTNGISNISNTTGGGSYSDYTAMSVAQFEGGLDVQFSITPTTGTHGIGLWIDWNNDGDFDDAGEQIYNSGTYVSAANGTITIPEGTPLGDYRIRVVANWLSTTPTPCGNLGNAAYGEAEDYTFSVIEQPDCMPPSGINAVEVTDSTAEIEWAAPTGQDTWFVYITDFGNPAPDDTTTDYEIATSSPYTIDDLDPSTQYDIYVKSDCGTDGQSFWIGPLSIYTTQVPAQMPFEEDFEGTVEWTLSSGTQTNQWVVGDAVGNDDNSLYISNDQGDTHAYTNTSTTVAHAFRDIQIPTDSESILLSFDWMAQAESCCDYIRVWVVPADFIPTPGTQISVANSGGVQFGGNFNQQNAWTNQFYEIPSTDYAGEIVRLVFEWRNDGSVGTQPPGAIDNVEVSEITCPTPTELGTVNTTVESIEIEWTAPDSQDSWEVLTLTQGSDAPDETTTGYEEVSDNPYTVEGLDSNTAYDIYVRANCGSDGTSSWVMISAMTNCEAFTVPFWEGFNSDSTTEQCWTILNLNGDGDQWDTNYTSNPYEGNQSAMLYTDFNGGNNDDWLITPHVDLTNDLGAALIKFHYRAQSSSEPNDYRVMLSTTGMNPDDFTLELMPLTVVSNTTYEEKIIYLLDEDGNPIQGEVYIAFHVPSGGLDGWRLYIDNVFIQPYNIDCPDPTDIEINVTCDSPPSASITWTAGTTGISWEYAVTLEGDPEPTEGTVVEENFVEIHDLEPNQDYVFWIKSNCGEAGETIWISTPFSSNASPVSQAQPFCAEEGGGIVFENGTNTGNVYGSLACLGTTPNPVWYYLQIDQPGDLDFQIIQNTAFDANGNPTGAGLDVDYIAWGPFDSMSDACMQIDLEVPTQNMLSCSYSAAAIENFSIPNAQPGEIYVLLLTNFSNNPGFIKLHQTNLDDGDSGNTDCSFLCEVDLGDDITVCAGVEVILEGEVASAGNTTDITETRWYFEDQLIDPDSYSEDGLSITVTQSGTYRLEVEKEMCTEEVVFDEIEVLFIPAYAGQIPPTIELCDELNDGVEVFNLGQYKNGLNLGDYDIELYASMDDLNSGINPLPDLYESGNTVIYAKISSSILASCSSVQEIELILIPLETPVVEFSYDDILCYDNLNSAVPYYEEGFTFGGTFSSSAGLFIDSQTGEIDVESSISGTYEVLYDYKVAPGNCGDDDSFTTTVTISEPILFEMVSYCNGGETIIDATNLRVSIPLESYNLIWIGADKVSENTAVARNTGTVTLRVEDEYGCWKEFYIEIDNTSCLITKGISPNGDGLNDYFDLSNYWVLDLKIFNRDGREVYSHGMGYTNEWEGQSNNGNLLPDGTYYYRIVTNVEEFTGWVQLTRETR